MHNISFFQSFLICNHVFSIGLPKFHAFLHSTELKKYDQLYSYSNMLAGHILGFMAQTLILSDSSRKEMEAFNGV